MCIHTVSIANTPSKWSLVRQVVSFRQLNSARGREVEFIKLCSHAMSGFAVHCNWLESEDGDGADKQLRVTFAGTYQGKDPVRVRFSGWGTTSGLKKETAVESGNTGRV